MKLQTEIIEGSHTVGYPIPGKVVGRVDVWCHSVDIGGIIATVLEVRSGECIMGG